MANTKPRTQKIGPWIFTEKDYGVDGGAPAGHCEVKGRLYSIGFLGAPGFPHSEICACVFEGEEGEKEVGIPQAIHIPEWTRQAVLGAVLEIATLIDAPAPIALIAGARQLAEWKGWW